MSGWVVRERRDAVWGYLGWCTGFVFAALALLATWQSGVMSGENNMLKIDAQILRAERDHQIETTRKCQAVKR